MHSTFMGLEIGKRGIHAHQTSLNTTGHNVANLNTPGYSRQRVKLSTVDPLYQPSLERVNTPGQLGQGPQVSQVERIFDILHENQILSTSDDFGYWETREFYTRKLEMIYAEPNETSVRSYMDAFWSSWQDLSANPESLANRSIVIERGKALAESINHRFNSLHEQRVLLNDAVKVTVNDINKKIEQIAAMNNRISMVRAVGDEPNDLLDRRDKLVNEVANLVPITVEHRDTDEFQLHVYGRTLVQGDQVKSLTLVEIEGDPGMMAVEWQEGNLLRDYLGKTGKLFGLLELRDIDVKHEIQKLDTMTINFSDMVNSLHRQGVGRGGSTGIDFFTQLPIIEDVNGNYDSNADGQYDQTYLFRLTGNQTLSPTQPVGIEGVMTFDGPQGQVQVPYYPADTVENIVERINYANTNVVARLDSQGRLSLKGTMDPTGQYRDFVIRYAADSGQFLVGYAGLLQQAGAEGAYNYDQINAAQVALQLGQGSTYSITPLANPAAWLDVNSQIKTDANMIAATKRLPTGEAAIGDSGIALAIADLRYEKVMVDRLTSMDDFFADSAALIGVKGSNAQASFLDFQARMKNLEDIKQSISGVNINEEFADLVRFQHGFSASARFITEVDKMLDTIIHRLGA
ncbi:MAG: flagellar hook-associated protein FlgK [Spirochaetia bacterium]